MVATLNARLTRLEQRQHRTHGPCTFDSVEAAQAAGVRGGWLHIGETMDAGEWAAAAKAQQAELCEVNHGNA